MKRAVSISIGSSKRNKAVEVTLLDEKISIERIGTDGDMEAAALKFKELDGTVDAFGVGGADLGAQTEASLFPARAGMNATIQIIFTAPFTDGEYESAWQAFDPGGLAFGDPIYIRVNVVAP